MRWSLLCVVYSCFALWFNGGCLRVVERGAAAAM